MNKIQLILQITCSSFENTDDIIKFKVFRMIIKNVNSKQRKLTEEFQKNINNQTEMSKTIQFTSINVEKIPLEIFHKLWIS